MPNLSILLVDDDLKLRLALTEYLSNAGYSMSTANSIGQMQTLLLHSTPDLLVLDRYLPDGNGFDACADLRSAHLHIPIIMLTASAEDAARIQGLDSGADDYMTKPFNPRELLARINAVLRRASAFSTTEVSVLSSDIHIGAFRYLSNTRTLRLDDHIVPLTREELVVFVSLLEKSGTVLSRLQIAQRLYPTGKTHNQRNIDMLISRIRQKLSVTLVDKSLIKTVRGSGYLLDLDQLQHISTSS